VKKLIVIALLVFGVLWVWAKLATPHTTYSHPAPNQGFQGPGTFDPNLPYPTCDYHPTLNCEPNPPIPPPAPAPSSNL